MDVAQRQPDQGHECRAEGTRTPRALTSLTLDRTQVTDEGLASLAKLSRLTTLSLDETQVSPAVGHRVALAWSAL
jgi:hypothetical protein